MLILTIRTDKPEAEIGLYDDNQQLAYSTWEAHRQLAETIHQKIEDVVLGIGKNLQELEGIILYKGPGSFTGLRIGAAVANALASSFQIPIVGETGELWIADGIKALGTGGNGSIINLEYGAEPNITKPLK